MQPPPAVEFADCRLPSAESIASGPELSGAEQADIIDILTGPIIPENGDWRDLSPEDINRYAPITADWSTPANELNTYQRLSRLARVKALLPKDNLEKRQTRHNKSIEGYMRLALGAAGDRHTLAAHMDLIEHVLADDSQGNRLLAEQTLWIWGPLAEIMGWGALKSRIEDAAFARLMPEEYAEVVAAYQAYGGDAVMAEYMESTRSGIAAVVEGELTPAQKGSVQVEVRQKSYYSVWRKCEKDQRPTYRLPDFIGARVIVDDAVLGETSARELCYQIKDWAETCYQEASRFKDYIFQPKLNGYQSLHISLGDFGGQQLELQVRTATMHARAETDPGASHIAYEATFKITPGKYYRELAKPHRIYLWRERAARELRQREESGDMSTDNLEPESLQVFRDNGNLHTLRQGYTVLDMAFDVHWQHALTTISASINGVRVAYDRRLRPYEVVKFDRTNNGRETWSLGWVYILESASAKAHVRRAIRKLDRPRLVGKATKSLTEHFERQGVTSVMSLFTPAVREQILQELSVESWDVVLTNYALEITGFGNGFFENWVRKLQPATEVTPITVTRHQTKKAETLSGQWQLVVGDEPTKHYRIPGCCPDSQGEPVVVLHSTYWGKFSVHRQNCRQIQGYIQENKVFPALWQQR